MSVVGNYRCPDISDSDLNSRTPTWTVSRNYGLNNKPWTRNKRQITAAHEPANQSPTETVVIGDNFKDTLTSSPPLQLMLWGRRARDLKTSQEPNAYKVFMLILPSLHFLSRTVWCYCVNIQTKAAVWAGECGNEAAVYKSWHEHWGANRERKACCWHSKSNRDINTAASLLSLLCRTLCDYACSLFRTAALPQIVKLVFFFCQAPRRQRQPCEIVQPAAETCGQTAALGMLQLVLGRDVPVCNLIMQTNMTHSIHYCWQWMNMLMNKECLELMLF